VQGVCAWAGESPRRLASCRAAPASASARRCSSAPGPGELPRSGVPAPDAPPPGPEPACGSAGAAAGAGSMSWKRAQRGGASGCKGAGPTETKTLGKRDAASTEARRAPRHFERTGTRFARSLFAAEQPNHASALRSRVPCCPLTPPSERGSVCCANRAISASDHELRVPWCAELMSWCLALLEAGEEHKWLCPFLGELER
jgi:hypothetical protein